MQLSEQIEREPRADITAWAMLLGLMLAAILSYTDRQILSLLVDPLRRSLSVSDTQIGLLQGFAFAIVYGLAAVPLGRMVDTYSRKIMLLAGIACWSCATVSCAIAKSFDQLFVCRMFVGVGEAVLMPASMSLIADRFPEKVRGTAIGIFIMAITVGASGASVVGGALLAAASAGCFAVLPWISTLPAWRQVLAMLGFAGLPMIILLGCLSEPRRTGRVSVARSGAVRRLWEHRKSVLPLVVAASLCSVGDYTILGWGPVFLSRKFGLAPGQIGLYLGVPAILGSVCGPPLFGWISDLRARSGVSERVRLCAITMSCAAFCGLLGLSSPPMTYVLIGLWMFFSVATVASAMIILQDLLPSDLRGTATALCALGSVVLGMGVGPLAASLLAEHVFGDPLSIGRSITIVVVLAAGTGAVLLWRLHRTSGRLDAHSVDQPETAAMA